MELLTHIFSVVLDTVIYVCSSVGTIAGIVSITRCLSKEDFNGAIKGGIMTLVGIAMIIGYPMMVKSIYELFNM
ncbi:MAG: hypothetical protein RSF40_01725 [Oscillospiraceae bacterium]